MDRYMAKNAKKSGRHLKKTVRKTLGTLFLVSAIVVAAIPTDGLQAAVTTAEDGTSSYTHVVSSPWYDGTDTSKHSETYPLTQTTATAKSVFLNTTDVNVTSPNVGVSSNIPICEDDTTVYSTGDGDFQFAYVDSTGNENGTGTKFAIILGYNHVGSLAGGTLTIPDAMDAYLNYNENDGTATGYVAVGKSGNYLFYQTEDVTQYYTTSTETVTQLKTRNGEQLYYYGTDTTHEYTAADIANGIALGELVDGLERQEVYEDVEVTKNTYYTPCSYSAIGNWENAVNLYYFATDDWKPVISATTGEVSPLVAASDGQYGRIKDASVVYIGNQYVRSITGGYEIAGVITDSSQGIFQSNGNIGTLIVGSNLSGIGDYAFYGCTALKSITLENGLNTIGNHAFDNCRNMTTINLPDECNINTIGAYAFKDCQGLTSFTLPINVTSIGDGAFKGCWSLESVNLASSGNGSLSTMGSYVFQDCSSLKSVAFPRGYSETVELSTFEGCTALVSMKTENTQFNIVSSTTCDFDWEAFKLQVTEQFYIEGPDSGTIHTTCTNNEVSFKYLDQDIYELTKKENGTGDPTVTYQVDSTNTLLAAKFNGTVTSLNFPNYIGPYYIRDIGDEAFMDHCSLTEISISSTVQSIGARAFQGCHNLEYVYFDNDTVTIGENAFLTQRVSTHERTCTNAGSMTASDNTPSVKLHFVGTLGSASTAYNYAMSYDGRYNYGSQALSFVEYLSGWPTCITVKYHYDTATGTGYSELVDFPTLYDLNNYATAEYLSEEEQAAAKDAINNMNNSSASLTEDQETFINAAKSLTIPAGVDAIEDGLFYEKTEDKISTAIPVYCYGLSAIEANYTSDTDDDGFAVVDPENSDFAGCTKLSEFYLYGDTTTIADKAFAGDDELTKVYVGGATSIIGDHAFADCDTLSNVSLSASVESLGIRPFAGCDVLTSVDFQSSPYYTCENSVIYGLTDGSKTKLVECLEGRTSRIHSDNDDLSTVTSMEDEAFEGTNLTSINLSSSGISEISTRAFANTTRLITVELPSAATATNVDIDADAFKGSYVSEIIGTQNVRYIAASGTEGIVTSTGDTNNTTTDNNKNVTIYAPAGSNLAVYATTYNYSYEETKALVYWTVTFYDWDAEQETNVSVSKQSVLEGESATAPTPAGRSGYIFSKWDKDYTEVYSDLTVTAVYETAPDGYGKHLVTYIDYDDSVYATEYVEDGGDALMSFKEPTRSGYTFTGWRGSLTNITADTTVYAEYKEGYLVRWYYYDTDGNKTLFYSDYIAEGESGPTLGQPISKSGYTFTGWLPSVTNITEPTDTYAQYAADGTTGIYTVNYYSYDGTLLQSYQVISGDSAPNVSAPAREGYTFTGWMPSLANVTSDRDVVATYTANSSSATSTPSSTTPTPTPTSSSSSNTNNNTTTKYYNLTVINGSGSGSYVEGAQPIIVANDPTSAQEFSNWSINPTSTKLASAVLSATVVTMPASDVTVTANYKAKSTSSQTSSRTTTGSGNSSTTNSSRTPTSSRKTSSGTTVVIDKNGLSNTGVVSATVNGSSDNFTIKVSESASASEEILKALMSEYGNDLSAIKYFPMDITLYDSTGTTKITDTTGLSVSITLPLPDSLITYAGNNKVAAVSNSKLEKLSPKFSTINGVSCVTFTAEHFSPYVIYVDTGNLTAGTADATPKTGDGIHPKWFLSVGLACISVIFFMKKDRKTLKKVKA